MNLTVQVRFGGGLAEKQVKLLAAFLPYSRRPIGTRLKQASDRKNGLGTA